MNERQSLAHFIMNMRQASECARQMVVHRRDPRWMRIAQVLDDINAKAKRVAETSARNALLILPKGMEH